MLSHDAQSVWSDADAGFGELLCDDSGRSVCQRLKVNSGKHSTEPVGRPLGHVTRCVQH